MKFHSLRVWPNGEFGVGLYRRAPVEPLPSEESAIADNPFPFSIQGALKYFGVVEKALEVFAPGFYSTLMEEIVNGGEASPLGLSNASNSHREPRRGKKGLTSYARKMLRNGCYLLEKWAGRRRVAMLTLTIPAVPPEVEKEVTREWAEIMRIFTQHLHRKLRAANTCPWVLGVYEIQEQRLEKYGGLPIHAHLVFQSRLGKEYTLTVDEVRESWKRAVCARVPSCESYSFRSSTRIESVKKSVANYLCKYMSKGISQNVLVSVENGYTLPSSWWVGVGKFKKAIARMMIYETGNIASEVWWMARNSPQSFEWIFLVEIGTEAEKAVIGAAGKMARRTVERIKQARATTQTLF